MANKLSYLVIWQNATSKMFLYAVFRLTYTLVR